MSNISKRVQFNKGISNPEKIYLCKDALELVMKAANAKFDETVEAIIHLGVNPAHSDQLVRGVVNLPNGTGKSVRVAVIAKESKRIEAEQAGADIIGAEDLIQEIKNGKLDFDICITTPDMMGFVGQVAKILGPKGLMPNPKLGTVTVDIANAVRNAKFGQVEFRSEKNGIVHAPIGKISFGTHKLEENLKSLINALEKAKPNAAKGVYLRKGYLSSTMGIGVKFDIDLIVKS